MASRYNFAARIIYRGDQDVAKQYAGEGRALLGQLMSQLAESNVKIGYMRRERDDVTIEVRYDGTTPVVILTAATQPTTPPPDTSQYELWVPRGFVVYPASDSSREGWGLPIFQDGSVPATDPTNLAPGLDVTRWTAAGGLGQVLLTRAPGAGYPAAATILPPLLYNMTSGLKPKAKAGQDASLDAATGDFAGYRLELTAYRGNSPTSNNTDSNVIAGFKETELALINNHRLSISLTSINRPIRGYYDSGQNCSEMEFAAGILGHYASQLPDTYQTPEDRAGHDGTTMQVAANLADDRNKVFSAGEILYSSATGVPIGTDPNGEDIDQLVPPASPIDPTAAYNWWMGSPPHRAIIEGAEFTEKNSFLYPGFKGTVACVEFVLHEQWINAGNQSWYSSDVGVPALSWFGPHALNLTWETWPVNLTGTPTTPFSVRQPFVLPFDDEGLCWLQTYYTQDQSEPTWDNRIFCRGRCIAIAPRGGLVWAAAVQSLTLNNAKVYRLIALVHDQVDQPADNLTNGMTPIVHVWYCDLPYNNYAGNPQTVIRGVFGEEDSSWPWITRNSSFSWKDAGTIDVSRPATGGAPTLLKYSSVWRFSPDATRAVCLRDVGALTDYASVYDNGASIGSGYFVSTGRMPAAMELVFGQGADGSLSVSKNFLNLAPGANAVPAGTDPYGGENVQRVMWPIAVDYDAANNVVAAFSIQQADAALMPPTTDVNTRTEAGRWFVGFGPWTANSPSQLKYNNFVGSYLSAPDQPVHAQPPVILDVNDGVFLSLGTRTSDIATHGSDDIGAPNPAFVPCFLNTNALVFKVDAYRQGLISNSTWYANFTFVLMTLQDVEPWVSGVFSPTVALGFGASSLLVGSYVKNRAGDFVYNYNVVPQPQTSFNASAGLDCMTAPLLFPRINPITGVAFNVPADSLWIGGWTSASFMSESALQAAVGNVGTNPRFLYSRVV